jgi:hypothetical protein
MTVKTSAILSLALLLGSGCDAPAETELATLAVSRDSMPPPENVGFDFRLASRTLHKEQMPFCKQVCDKWVPLPKDNERCVHYHEECNLGWKFLGLYPGSPGDPGPQVFPAYDDANWSYEGCGPQAAQNILAYYGVHLPIKEVAKWFVVWKFPWDPANKQTTPDALAIGLQNVLDHYALGTYRVTRGQSFTFYWPASISLSRGNPIITIVNGGAHWQVVTGYRWNNGGEYRVIDYPGENGETWKNEDQLRRNLEGGMELWGSLFQFEGFDHGAMITIERTD